MGEGRAVFVRDVGHGERRGNADDSRACRGEQKRRVWAVGEHCDVWHIGGVGFESVVVCSDDRRFALSEANARETGEKPPVEGGLSEEHLALLSAFGTRERRRKSRWRDQAKTSLM